MQKLARASYWAVLLVTAIFVFQSFLRVGINAYVKAQYLEMIDGTAYRPFVSRMLLPGMVGLVAAVTPADAQRALNDYAVDSVTLCARLTLLGMDPQAFFLYLVGCVLMFGSLIGFVFAFRELMRSLFEVENPLADFMTLAALLGLPPMFTPIGYVYDIPQLFLWTLGLLMLAKGRLGTFLLIYALGLFNKETTVLLSVVYFLTYLPWNAKRPVNRARVVKYGIAQLLLFLAFQAIVSLRFSGNPGQAVEFHLLDHNIALLRGYSPGVAVIGLGLVLLVGYRWREKPRMLQYALIVALPLFAATLFFGNLDELRVYLEVYPTVLLMMVPAIGSVLGYRVSVRAGVVTA